MKKSTAKFLSDLLNGKKAVMNGVDDGTIEPAKWLLGSIEIPKDEKKK